MNEGNEFDGEILREWGSGRCSGWGCSLRLGVGVCRGVGVWLVGLGLFVG